MSLRSGFIALVGKPNVGKSTLVNTIIGQKVAITSSKPQTTRQRMLGVLHGEGYQAVLVDTPGMMRPKNRLHRQMISQATSEARTADLVLWLVESSHFPTAEDKTVAEFVSGLSKGRPVWIVTTKNDLLKEGVEEACKALCPEAQQHFSVSAVSGDGVPELVAAIAASLPEGPPFFPPDQVSEQNDQLWLAEVIREKVIEVTRQEIPHAVAVTVDELREGKSGPGSLYAHATLFVERESQKGILIGKGGALLKKVGSQTRQELEASWGKPLFLELWVKVKKDWRDRDDRLRQLGYA